jgi:integrase
LELQAVNHAGNGNTVHAILESYCEFMAKHMKASTLDIRKDTFLPFVAEFGKMRVDELKRFAINKWLDSRTSWGPTRRNMAIAGLTAAFNWGIDQELITVNPFRGVKQAARQSRGKEAYLTAEQIQRILEDVSPDVRDYVVVLRETGARPSEIAHARGSDYSQDLQALVYPWQGRDDGYTHKTHHHGKDRTIMLTGEALRIIEQRIAKYGKSYLFPKRANARSGPAVRGGKPRNKQNICILFWKMAERVGLPNLTAYSFRHTFATNWLLRRKSIDDLAELIGSSPNNIRRHYAHLEVDRGSLRAELLSFLQAVNAGSLQTAANGPP